MFRIDEVAARLVVEHDELVRWVENRWLLPQRQGEDWIFEEVDLARARLIAEMRRELELGEEALGLVLSLIDQLYAVRRDHRLLCEALRRQPEALRAALAEAIEELSRDAG